MGLRGLTRVFFFFVGEGGKKTERNLTHYVMILCDVCVVYSVCLDLCSQTKVPPPSELSPPYFDKVQLIRIQPF